MSETKPVPEEFTKVMRDFVGDLRFTFPEYESFINKVAIYLNGRIYSIH